MIQSNIRRMMGPEPIRFSACQFRFVVEALDNTVGEPLFCSKPVQQQRQMDPQTAGNPLHGLNLGTYRLRAPCHPAQYGDVYNHKS